MPNFDVMLDVLIRDIENALKDNCIRKKCLVYNSKGSNEYYDHPKKIEHSCEMLKLLSMKIRDRKIGKVQQEISEERNKKYKKFVDWIDKNYNEIKKSTMNCCWYEPNDIYKVPPQNTIFELFCKIDEQKQENERKKRKQI